MSIPEDTPALYALRQQNQQEDCPCVYPQLSPAIRPAVARNRWVFLSEWGSILGSMVGFCAAWAINFFAENFALVLGMLALVLLAVYYLCRILRRMVRWRCPCCGTDFPRNVPDGRSTRLEGEELLAELRCRGIPYRKLKWSHLYLPAGCPVCGKKFFVQGEEEPFEQ